MILSIKLIFLDSQSQIRIKIFSNKIGKEIKNFHKFILGFTIKRNNPIGCIPSIGNPFRFESTNGNKKTFFGGGGGYSHIKRMHIELQKIKN